MRVWQLCPVTTCLSPTKNVRHQYRPAPGQRCRGARNTALSVDSHFVPAPDGRRRLNERSIETTWSISTSATLRRFYLKRPCLNARQKNLVLYLITCSKSPIHHVEKTPAWASAYLPSAIPCRLHHRAGEDGQAKPRSSARASACSATPMVRQRVARGCHGSSRSALPGSRPQTPSAPLSASKAQRAPESPRPPPQKTLQTSKKTEDIGCSRWLEYSLF